MFIIGPQGTTGLFFYIAIIKAFDGNVSGDSGCPSLTTPPTVLAISLWSTELIALSWLKHIQCPQTLFHTYAHTYTLLQTRKSSQTHTNDLIRTPCPSVVHFQLHAVCIWSLESISCLLLWNWVSGWLQTRAETVPSPRISCLSFAWAVIGLHCPCLTKPKPSVVP